jgi:hypothetical protein
LRELEETERSSQSGKNTAARPWKKDKEITTNGSRTVVLNKEI